MIFKENSRLLCSVVCVVFFLFMLHNNLQLVFTALEDNKFCQLDMRKFDCSYLPPDTCICNCYKFHSFYFQFEL